MELEEILYTIQKELKAPKGQRNDFGNFNYRSSEDILNAVKPLLNGCILLTSDDLVNIGERYYVKATAKISLGQSEFSATGFAREALNKKGMDEAQITGSASSYARKYALNGLFCIDDNKDFDTNEHKSEVDNTPNWYNDFDLQKNAMITKIKSGEQTAQGIIDSLKKSGYAISNKTKDLIKGLEK